MKHAVKLILELGFAASGKAGHRFVNHIDECFAGFEATPRAHDGQVLRQATFYQQIIQSRVQFALGQISGGPENDK